MSENSNLESGRDYDLMQQELPENQEMDLVQYFQLPIARRIAIFLSMYYSDDNGFTLQEKFEHFQSRT